MTRLLTLIYTAVVAAIYASAATPLTFPQSEAATVGIAVVDLSTGRYTESQNIEQVMVPASILKSVTSAAVLSSLGEHYTFKTAVKTTGEVRDGILYGNIEIYAAGDPTIESTHFPQAGGFCDSIINNIKRKGIHTISGEIIVNEDDFSDRAQNPQWTVGDLGCSYGAGSYGFNYRDNTFTINTATETTVPEVPMADISMTAADTSIDVIHGIDSDIYQITGRGLNKPTTRVTVPMNSPADVFITELTAKLFQSGISVKQEKCDPASATDIIYTHISPKLKEILKSLMVRSDNMMAEGVLRALTPGQSRDSAIKAEQASLQSMGVSRRPSRIFDGSGLARADRISPAFLADVLTQMAKSKYAQTYTSLFPKVGKEGTVKTFLARTPLQGKLALKTGSLNGVHCYAGYKLDANGNPTHAVVVMVNNFFCTRDVLRSKIQDWFLTVFR